MVGHTLRHFLGRAEKPAISPALSEHRMELQSWAKANGCACPNAAPRRLPLSLRSRRRTPFHPIEPVRAGIANGACWYWPGSCIRRSDQTMRFDFAAGRASAPAPSTSDLPRDRAAAQRPSRVLRHCPMVSAPISAAAPPYAADYRNDTAHRANEATQPGPRGATQTFSVPIRYRPLKAGAAAR